MKCPVNANGLQYKDTSNAQDITYNKIYRIYSINRDTNVSIGSSETDPQSGYPLYSVDHIIGII